MRPKPARELIIKFIRRNAFLPILHYFKNSIFSCPEPPINIEDNLASSSLQERTF